LFDSADNIADYTVSDVRMVTEQRYGKDLKGIDCDIILFYVLIYFFTALSNY
jgi:hypothetical protein